MIISHKHRLVFVEFPRTGSTAISAELIENYGGQSILRKHSHYSSFLRVATRDEKEYRVASGIRNPLDDAVSWYEKYCSRTDYATRASRLHRKRYRYIHKHDADFSTFLRKYYRLPYDSWTNVHHKKMDQIIRFESIQDGFSELLRLVGAEQIRPLPMRNKTSGRKDFEQYYDEDLRSHAVKVFGPYLQEWGYDFPTSWGARSVPLLSKLLYSALRGPRGAYWTYMRQPNAQYGALFRRIFFSSAQQPASAEKSNSIALQSSDKDEHA